MQLTVKHTWRYMFAEVTIRAINRLHKIATGPSIRARNRNYIARRKYWSLGFSVCVDGILSLCGRLLNARTSNAVQCRVVAHEVGDSFIIIKVTVPPQFDALSISLALPLSLRALCATGFVSCFCVTLASSHTTQFNLLSAAAAHILPPVFRTIDHTLAPWRRTHTIVHI